MKTSDILDLDYRKEENKEIVQKALKRMKPLAKYSEDEIVPLEAIEKLISVMVKKYAIRPQFMYMSYGKQVDKIYHCGIKNDNTNAWLGNVYGITLYELFAKIAIKMFSEVKAGNVDKRTLTKEEKEREKIAKQIDEYEG